MHFCEEPFRVWEHYPPFKDGKFTEYAEVEADEADCKYLAGKYCTTKLKIGAKLDLHNFVMAGADFILEHSKANKDENTGDCSAATNTGNHSAATNTGGCSAATNTGDCSAATSTGGYSAATVEGGSSIAIVTGYMSKAKGALGCWLVFTERDENLRIKKVEAVCVDGKTIKADTFYMLVDGEVVGMEEQ